MPPAAVYAEIARAIAAHEPVTMVAAPDDAAGAAAACAMPRCRCPRAADRRRVDARHRSDRRARTDGARHAVHFRFNAWGEKYTPYEQDADVGARIARALGLPVHEAPLVLEGGSIAVDGAGTLVTTERCLLNENRNPGTDQPEIEAALRHWLGVDRVVWLADGIAEDAETDGHVDNVVAFIAAGPRVRCRAARSRTIPNHAIATDNGARSAPQASTSSRSRRCRTRRCRAPSVPVPYVNFYVANGVVVGPDHRRAERRCRARTDRIRVSRPRGRRGARRGPRVRRRWRALHHAAGPRHDRPHRLRRARVAGACRRAAPAGPVRVGLVQHALEPRRRRARGGAAAKACASRPAPARSWCASRS